MLTIMIQIIENNVTKQPILFTDIFHDDLITVLSKQFINRNETMYIKNLTKTCKKYNDLIMKMIMWNTITLQRSKINIKYILMKEQH